MNDAAVRGLIGKASGAQNAMNEYHGASARAITVGSSYNSRTGFYTYGYNPAMNLGGMTDNGFRGDVILLITWSSTSMTVRIDNAYLAINHLYQVDFNGSLVTHNGSPNGDGSTYKQWYFDFPSNLPTSGDHPIELIGL